MRLTTRRTTLGFGVAALGVAILPTAASADADPYGKAVDEGLMYFRRRADEQRPLAKALTDAIRARDLVGAKAAYIASRPPYEEIEVLAASFEETDKAIDSRPYAFEGGETDSGFKGFHKVEALLFRDEDLAGALPVAEELERSLATLVDDLTVREAFSAKKTFAGLLALSTEIGAKKISSEEETWSDRSLLIFRFNLVGIDSQYRPFAPELAKRNLEAADAVATAYATARGSVDRIYGPDSGGTSYSRIGIRDRKAISDATYRYRETLGRAADLLGLRM